MKNLEGLINQVVIFSACSEIYSIFGVHGLHFVTSYIADFFIAKGVVSQLVNMEQDEVPVMVAAITASTAIGVSSLNYDDIELPEKSKTQLEENGRELIISTIIPVVIEKLNEPLNNEINRKTSKTTRSSKNGGSKKKNKRCYWTT